MRPIYIDARLLSMPFIIPAAVQACQIVFDTASVPWVRAVGQLGLLAIVGFMFRLFLRVHEYMVREQELWEKREEEAERERQRLAIALRTPPAERTDRQRAVIREFRATERALELEQAAAGLAAVRKHRAQRIAERRRREAEIARLAQIPGALSPDRPRRVQ